MTESMLLEIVRKLPPRKAQEIYDFARFLAQSDRDSKALRSAPKIEGFSSEEEMVDFINDVGKLVYAD